MSETSQLWSKDRPMLMERMARLLGSTTFTTPDSGGGTPFSARKLTTEAEMLVALKMAGTHQTDIGPWIVYSIALRIDDRKRQIVEWLAGKLERGTGTHGRRNANRMLTIASAAYDMAVHGIEPEPPKNHAVDFVLLANIGAGWMWVKCDNTVIFAERALKSREVA